MQHNPTHSQKESNTLKVYHTQSKVPSAPFMICLHQYNLH